MKNTITVIGSINLDLVIAAAQLPRPGQTLIADSLAELPGGKGANQAVAVARLGANVTMVGRVGNDAFGARLLENLKTENIDVQFVNQSAGSSGVAVVSVDASGQNAISIVPGANGLMTVDDVEHARNAISQSAIVLLQLEIPMQVVLRAIEICRECGTPVMLDPAPAPTSLLPGLLRVDYLCPNETEAAAIADMPVESETQIAATADRLHELGAGQTIITLGDRGACLRDANGGHTFVDAYPIQAVDTTAAGDAFAAAFAVRVAENAASDDAMRFACAAGAIAASRKGAQPAMPTRAEVESLMAR